MLQATKVPEMNEVVQLLGNGDGITLVPSIIQNPFLVDVGDRPLPVSFQKVILPLISLVSSPSFSNSPYVPKNASHLFQLLIINQRHAMPLRTIYNSFYNSTFIEDVMRCVEELTERLNINDLGQIRRGSFNDNIAWVPPNWVGVVDPVVSFFISSFPSLFSIIVIFDCWEGISSNVHLYHYS